MKKAKYMVYRMHNKTTGDSINLYFLPEDSVMRTANRISTLAEFQIKGYVVTAFMFANEEGYYNAKLTDVVNSFLKQYEAEEKYRKMYRKGEIPRELAVQTIRLCRNYENTCLASIHRLLRRMSRNDIPCHNEMAIQLDDFYSNEILQV